MCGESVTSCVPSLPPLVLYIIDDGSFDATGRTLDRLAPHVSLHSQLFTTREIAATALRAANGRRGCCRSRFRIRPVHG